MTSASTLQGFLARFEAFRGVDEALLAEITSKASLQLPQATSCWLPMNFPIQVYAVIEGRARLLHHDPGVEQASHIGAQPSR